jgi:hypothetical protein
VTTTIGCNWQWGRQPLHPRYVGSIILQVLLYSLVMQVMPGIIMNGTMPTFYKIPVTTNLVHNVMGGTYPPEPTIVSVYAPDLPSPQGHYSEGMKPLGNRQEVLCCFEAFKCIIGI